VAQAAETKARDARKRVRALTTGRPGRPVGFALTLASPGSQFIDEHGHTYVSPDGERVAYVGRGRPFRPGWQAWGDEMAELPR